MNGHSGLTPAFELGVANNRKANKMSTLTYISSADNTINENAVEVSVHVVALGRVAPEALQEAHEVAVEYLEQPNLLTGKPKMATRRRYNAARAIRMARRNGAL